MLAETASVSAEPLVGAGRGIWRYGAHLPLRVHESWIGLGEGSLALVPAADLADRLGVRQVWLAVDYLTPTGSFKDRTAAAAVAHAVQHGARGVVCASSGNAAAAAAAYAARASLPAVILVPEATPPPKIATAHAFGATILRVPGDYSHCFQLARQLCAESGFANVATTYVNPTAVAALRTVAFELVQHLEAVDHVLVPTGAGALVHGVAAGFRYLAARRETPPVPGVDAVQLAGCAPIVRAFEQGEDTVSPWPHVNTRISGLNDPLRSYPGDGTVTLAEVRHTGGAAVAVDNEETLAAQRWLATQHGVFVEPAAATSAAALSVLSANGRLSADNVVVCLLTGHGLKTLDTASASSPVEPLVDTIGEATGALARMIPGVSGG